MPGTRDLIDISFWGGLEADSAPQSLQSQLDRIRQHCGLEMLQWLPCDPPLHDNAILDRNLKDVPWGIMPAIQPGGVRRIGEQDRLRLPRLGVLESSLFPSESWEALVRTQSDARQPGVLRIRAHAAPQISDVGLRSLVGVVSGLAAAHGVDRPRREPLAEIRVARRVAGAVHDLRNALCDGLLQADFLHEGYANGETLSFDRLRGALAVAREMCGDTLEGRAGTEPRRSCSLSRIMKETARVARSSPRAAVSSRILLRCDSHLRVHAGRNALTRLLQNLTLNAVEASYDGGEVRLSAHEREDGRIEVLIRDEGRGLSGRGLREFLRSGQGSAGGTGFGSTSILELAEELDAELVFDTAPGAGMSVSVHLHTPDESHEGGETRRVAVLDVITSRRRRWAQALVDGGMQPLECLSPGQVVARMRAIPVAAVVLARGTWGAGFDALYAECTRQRTKLVVTGSLGGSPERQVCHVLDALKS